MSIVKFVKIAVAATVLTAFTLPMISTGEALAASQAPVAKKDQKQVKKTAKKVAKKDTGKDVKKASAKKVAKKPAAKKTDA